MSTTNSLPDLTQRPCQLTVSGYELRAVTLAVEALGGRIRAFSPDRRHPATWHLEIVWQTHKQEELPL